MASLPLSSLPSGSLHLDAFQDLNYSLGRGLSENDFILTTIRRCGEHEVEDRINIWILSRRNGGVYVSASCAGKQCCPCAPQGDPRYLLFNNGDWLKGDDERVLISQSDEPCSGAQEIGSLDGSDRTLVGSVPCGGGQETGALTESASSHSVVPACEIDRTSEYSTKSLHSIQLMSHERPAEADSLIIAKILSGLTRILLSKSDYSSDAIKTAWEGNKETSSLLDLWDHIASSKADVMSVIMVTEKRTMKSRGEAEYLHWLGKIMVGCLVYAQTKGELLPKTYSKENRFIKWARRLPKLLRLIQVAGITGLLVLTAIGNSFYNFYELGRTPESSLDNLSKAEWANLRPKLSYLYHRLRGTPVFNQEVAIFNPVAFCCRYLQLQREESMDYGAMCQTFGASDWVKAKSDVFERKTIGELLAPQEDPGLDLSSYRASDKDSKGWKELVAAVEKLVVDEETQPTSAAERQTPPSQQGTTSCGPSYNTGHILSTSHDCTSPHTRSEYREDNSSILEEPDASADDAAGLGGADPRQNGSGNLVPDHDPADQSAACIRETDAMAPIEGPLFMPFQTSIDNSYVSNVESQQVHGTPSAASPSRSLMFRSPLPSCRTAARQKRLQARDNAVPFSRPQFDPVHDAASPYHSEGAASGQRTTAGLLSRQSHADLRLSLVAFDQFALENPTAETEFAGRLSPRGSSYQAYSSSQAPGQPQPAGVAQNLPREVTSLSLVDPAPDASLQRIIMPDASAHDQMLSYRAVCDLNALASAASQTCPLYHDGDSGYGGSAMSSQSSMATSAMPIPFGDRETTDPAIRSVSLGGPERPNNVPARPLGGHRTALPDEAPLPAAATGSNPTTRRLPVLDSTSDKVVVDNPPVGTNRRPHTAGQKRSAESEGSDHRLSRKRHNPPTMDAEHEHNTDLHSPVPESTNNSIWELGPSSEHQTDRTIAIEETPGLGVFASSSTAYNDNRDNGESNASNDFSALVSVDSFATVPNAPVEVDHPHHVSNVQTYGVGWGPLDWADSSGQQAEPDLPDFTLCPADLDLKTQNMQSYGVSWGPLDWADSSGQQAVPNVFEPNLTGSGTGENAQS